LHNERNHSWAIAYFFNPKYSKWARRAHIPIEEGGVVKLSSFATRLFYVSLSLTVPLQSFILI